MSDQLQELSNRCETALEPDRELDLQIFIAVSGNPWRWCSDDGAVTWDRYGPGAAGNPVYHLDEYTASFEAACSLLSAADGWHGEVSFGKDIHRQGLQMASARRLNDRKQFTALGKTPALALCAVALHARALAVVGKSEQSP